MNNLFETVPESIIKSKKKIELISNEDEEDILKMILDKEEKPPKKEKIRPCRLTPAA